MILNSQPKQFRLQDDGQIFWQADATNPLPGVPVAKICKGESALKPGVEVLECDAVAGQDRQAVSDFISAWLQQHIATVLEKLVGLVNPEGIEGPAKEISQKVYDALGILPRQDLEPLIAGLDAEARKVLRQRHVRLGPVLVFVPELNKPAAVRLRALLWWLSNDRPLPAPVPKDGVVSLIVDEAQIDPVYQRAIGYPVYGGRAIRADMLDRLICSIYDTAKDGSFRATHTMAEWLGASIPDLYKVLEAMGHKKTHDPAEQPKVEAPVTAEVAAEAPLPVAPAPVAKPELATFKLKRGKANESERPRAPRPERAVKKPAVVKPDYLTPEDKLRIEARAAKQHPPRREKKPQREEKQVFVMEARPEKTGDSPFAMLQQLKAGKKD